ncbi:MAG: response regulator [Candidatus Omnitrophica bacterium]|nr:response regulator [Candidatus Omnitrophota bacterium]
MDKELAVLILEDVDGDAALLQEELRKEGFVFTLRRACSKDSFIKLLEEFSPDIILSDYRLPSFDGLAALTLAKEKYPDVPFIFVSGTIGEEFAIETIKSGATDYVLKDNLTRLAPVVKRALQEAHEHVQRKKAQEDLLRREYQLEILTRTSRHINAVLDASTIMQTLLAAAMELVDATSAAAGLLCNGTLVFKEYNKGGRRILHGGEPSVDQAVIENISETLSPYISNDAAHDARVSSEKQMKFEIYNLVNVPIIDGRGEIIGCFEIHNKKEQQPFDIQDAFMLQGLAASAAVALENARLLSEKKVMSQEIFPKDQGLTPSNGQDQRNYRVLILEDNKGDAALIEYELQKSGTAFTTQCVENKNDFILALKQFSPHLILSDYSLPDFNGLEAMAIVKAEYPGIPFIIISGAMGEEFAVETLQKGAADYVLKDRMFRLGTVVNRTLEDTEHRLASRRAEENFHIMVESAPYAIILCNDKKGIQFANKAAQELFGYSSEELLKMQVEDLVPKPLRETHRKLHEDFYREVRSRPMGPGRELHGVKKDGSEVTLEIGLTPIKTVRGSQVMASIKDISERKRYEEELIRLKNALEEKVEEQSADLIYSQAKLIQAEKLAILGQFAGAIGHEFRNQLGVMRNTAYFIKMKLADEEDKKIVKHLNILEEEIIGADKTIENLMSFAKTSNINVVEVNLEELILEGLENNVTAAIEVDIQIEKDLPIIQADPLQLKSIFSNIIMNAVQAMKDKGKLFIEAVQEKDNVIIRFKDNGCGIKKEDQDLLFTPLFTTKPRGTGLGLLTVKKFVESHHGTIDIQSHINKGTMVTIRLPIRHGSAVS